MGALLMVEREGVCLERRGVEGNGDWGGRAGGRGGYRWEGAQTQALGGQSLFQGVFQRRRRDNSEVT